MSFPRNADVGTTHVIPAGITYVHLGNDVWKVLSQPSSTRIKYTVSATAPEAPSLSDQWYDTVNTQLMTWMTTGTESRWVPIYDIIDGNDDGSGSNYKTLSDYVLPISWLYSSEGFSWEKWTDDRRYSWRDMIGTDTTEGYLNDNALDVVDTTGFVAGQGYVVYDAKPAGTYRQEIDVQSVLNRTRVRLRNNLNRDIGPDEGIRLSRTSFDIRNGLATVKNGDVYFSEFIDSLRDRQNGRFIIRRTASGTGEFSVAYREPGSSVWTVAPLTGTASRDVQFREETYRIDVGGTLQLRIRYRNDNVDGRETIQHFTLFPAPEVTELGYVEKPVNVTPADQAKNISRTPTLVGSPYRSLYNVAQAGAEFQIAADPNFSDLVVSSSSNFLSSWVNVSGQTGAWRDCAIFGNGDMALMSATAFRYSTDKGSTFVDRARPFAANAKKFVTGGASKLYACGENGSISYTSNLGVSWTPAAVGNVFTGTFEDISGLDTNILVVGSNGEIQRSINDSAIFNKVNPDNGFTGTFYGVAQSIILGRAIVVGSNGEIQTSVNGGVSWTKRVPANNYTGTFYACIIESDGTAFAVGTGGEIQRSEDFGSTWQHVDADNYSGTFYSVSVSLDTYILVTGENGAIQGSEDHGLTFQKRIAAAASVATFYQGKLSEKIGLLVGDNVVQRTLSLEGVATNSYTIPADAKYLDVNRVYYWRTRYQDAAKNWSAWSDPTAFATKATFDFIAQPSNLAPADDASGVPLTPTLQASSFAAVGSPDTHGSSEWQISPTAGFSTLTWSTTSTTAKTTITLPNGNSLPDRTTFYWRVRYYGQGAEPSAWSIPTKFTTRLVPNRPAIVSPVNGSSGAVLKTTLTSSTFSINQAGISHTASQWQVATDAAFTAAIRDSGESATALTSFTVDPSLTPNTLYYARVRHRGTSTEWSQWSVASAFTTSDVAVRAPTVSASSITATGVTLTTSAFTLDGGGVSDTHQSTDWEVTNASTGEAAYTSYGNASQKITLTVGALAPNVTYNFRARHRGATYGLSAWSTTGTFKTSSVSVRTPDVSSSAITVTSATANSSNFVLVGAGASDSHVASDWEIINTSGGLVRSSYNNTANLTAFNFTGLTGNTTYYARVRHRGATYGYSAWSAYTTIATAVATVRTPDVAVNGVGVTTASFYTSGFSVSGAGAVDTHNGTDWEVINSAGTLVYSSYGNTSALTTLNVGGLAGSTTHFMRARHRGATYGYSAWSAYAQFTTVSPTGESYYTTAGNYVFTVPAGVFAVHAVCIGGGSIHGGGLGWRNNIAVTPGQNINITVGAGGRQDPNNRINNAGGSSSFGSYVGATGGGSQGANYYEAGYGGQPVNAEGGGSGGQSRMGVSNNPGGAGGGAGGYSGKGGSSASTATGSYEAAGAGAGGGGGGASNQYAGGGGVGMYGQGANGAGAANDTVGAGFGGSGGTNGTRAEFNVGGNFGGGCGINGTGGVGAVRVIWGPGRSFPSNAG